MERVLVFARELVEKGELAGIEQRNIYVDEAKTAIEMFTVGGDSLTTVLEWDDQLIGDGNEGPIVKTLKIFLLNDFANLELIIPIDYSLYQTS